MVKKRSLSGSEYEKETSPNSKKHKHNINNLLRNANISSKSQMLKNELIQNGLHHILKKTKNVSEIRHRNKLDGKIEHESKVESSSSDDSDHDELKTKRHQLANNSLSTTVNNKIKERKRAEVSSSSELSNEEHKSVSFNVKEEIVSATDSESDSSEKMPSIISPRLPQNKVTKLDSSSANKTLAVTAGLNRSNIGSKKVRKQKLIDGNTTSTPDSSDNEKGVIEKSTKVILNRKSRGKSDDNDSSEEQQSSKPRLQDYKKIMEDIERRIEPISNKSSKEKVNVLQNILLTPPKYKPLKEKLEEMYPGIKLRKNNMTIELSNTEDVYLFRIPKNVSPSSLENAEISLDRKCKIKIDKKYNIEPTPNMPSPTLIIADNSKVLNFKGDIRMEKYIKSNKNPNLTIPEVKPVPLPDNLKNRHPLFGSEYKKKIKLSEHLKQKVDDAIDNLLKKEKSKKKKHKKIKHEVSEDGQNETIFTLLNSHSQVNKKIKREISDDNPSTSSADLPNKLNNSFDGVSETLRRIKSEIVTETESEHPEHVSVKRKKKNKQSHSHLEKINTVIKAEPGTNVPENKDRLLVNSTFIPDILKTPSFNPEVSRIKFEESTSEKTAKKRKKKDGLEEERSLIEKELISDIMDRLKSDLITPSKKVKRKKHPLSE